MPSRSGAARVRFTGVRLAASIAQGLGFAADLPLLPISDLRALAAQALLLPGAPACALICQDARMGEVYWGCFERQADNSSRGSRGGRRPRSAGATAGLPR